MYRTVVELDTLTDTDRTGTEYDNLFLVAVLTFNEFFRFVLVIIGGVEIRRFCLEFACTGIYHFIYSMAVHWALLAGNTFNGRVQIAVLLCQQVQIFGQRLGSHFPFQFDQVHQLVQEPAVYHGQFMQFFYRLATLHCLIQLECTLIVYDLQPLHNFFQRHFFILLHVHGIYAQFRRTNSLHNGFFEAGTDCHDFTGRFHLGAQCPLCVDKLIKCPLRILDNDVVQSRLEAGVGLAGNLIDNFVQCVADRDSCGNLCNRVTGRLGS